MPFGHFVAKHSPTTAICPSGCLKLLLGTGESFGKFHTDHQISMANIDYQQGNPPPIHTAISPTPSRSLFLLDRGVHALVSSLAESPGQTSQTITTKPLRRAAAYNAPATPNGDIAMRPPTKAPNSKSNGAPVLLFRSAFLIEN